MVSTVLAAHEERNAKTALEFKRMDAHEDGKIDRRELESYFRYMVRGREDYVHRRKDAVRDAVDKLFKQLDTNQDGYVTWHTFSEWNRRHSVEALADEVLQEAKAKKEALQH